MSPIRHLVNDRFLRFPLLARPEQRILRYFVDSGIPSRVIEVITEESLARTATASTRQRKRKLVYRMGQVASFPPQRLDVYQNASPVFYSLICALLSSSLNMPSFCIFISLFPTLVELHVGLAMQPASLNSPRVASAKEANFCKKLSKL